MNYNTNLSACKAEHRKCLVMDSVQCREESAKSDILVIWTDCDREGESIGAEVAKVCLESNRRLDVYRAR